jgi:hypothetical protein
MRAVPGSMLLVTTTDELTEDMSPVFELAVAAVDDEAAPIVAVWYCQFASSRSRSSCSGLQMETPTPEQMLEKALMAASMLLPQSLTRVCSTVLPLAQISLMSSGEFCVLCMCQLSSWVFNYRSCTHLTAFKTHAGGVVAEVIWTISTKAAKTKDMLNIMIVGACDVFNCCAQRRWRTHGMQGMSNCLLRCVDCVNYITLVSLYVYRIS